MRLLKRRKSNNSTLWLKSDGEIANSIRAKDWSKTPFGPIETWPSSLKTMLGVALGSRFPMLIWWGPDLLHLYNDAYRPILRDKHPASLGAPAAKIWAEVWDVAGPMANGVMNGGPATWTEDLQLFIKSGEMAEETYFTFSYSPIPDESGGVAGILNTVQETTTKVRSERQIQMLRGLAALAANAKSEPEAHQSVMHVLSQNQLDLPFALLYKLDDDHRVAHLVAKTGLDNYHGPLNAAEIPIRQSKTSETWPITKALEGLDEVLVDSIPGLFESLPLGPWNARPTQALILPIARIGQTPADMFLITGISPHRKLDERYKGFFRATAEQVSGVVASAHAYQAETKRAEDLAELDRLKTQFFTNVSHEFRTPLTLMLGPLTESLADPSLSPERVHQLELAKRNALRLQKLVNNMLDFSSLEAAKMKLTFQPVELGGVTRDLASAFQSSMDDAGLAYSVDCPPLKQKVYINYDSWEKIVFNLLSNALKYTLKGSVNIGLRSKGSVAELTIADTGSGMSKSEIPRLFERFHRIQGTKSRSFEGSGIGLAMISELVKLHGGTIQATSKPGKGTVFTVRIPFGAAHLPKDQVTQAKTGVDAHKGDIGAAYLEEANSWVRPTKAIDSTSLEQQRKVKSRWRETILVVDDNADMRDYVSRIVNANTSLSVATAANGKEALKIIAKHMPSLIISDIMMHEMDGIEFVSKLRQNPAATNVPIIFLSARAGQKEREAGIIEGVDDYLVKPFSADELLAHVHARLNLAQRRNRTTTTKP